MKTKMNLVIHHWSKIEGVLCWRDFNTELEIEIDMQEVARQLGDRALGNKLRRSKGLSGAVVVTVLKANIVKGI